MGLARDYIPALRFNHKILNTELLNSGFELGRGRALYVMASALAGYSDFQNDHPPFSNGDTSIYNTVDAAFGGTRASRGDAIFVVAAHTETIIAAAGIAQDVAGTFVIGLGSGDNVPSITFGTAVGASWAISANDCSVVNIRGVAGLDSLTNPFNVTGGNPTLDIRWDDGSATVEAVRAILMTDLNGANIKLRYNGFTAGDAVVNAIRCNNVGNSRIDVDFYGRGGVTAVVEFVTALCDNIVVTGRAYTSGITNQSRLVVDTITGSLWAATMLDMTVGQQASGGSGAAMALDDVSAVVASIGTITNTGGTATIGAVLGDFANTTLLSKLNVPAADAVTNVDVADVVGNKTDAAIADTIEGAAATTQSVLADVKAVLQRIGADSANNTAATTLVVGNADGSVFERLENLQAELSGGVGIASFPTSAAPANGVSLAEVLREMYDQQEKAVTNTTAVITTGGTIFTIAGGPIEIISLTARCVTANVASGAQTLQWSADPTDGAAATFSGASADVQSVVAGAMVVLQGTTLATAPIVATTGVTLGQQVTNGIVIGAGIITTTYTGGPSAGTWQQHLRYRPLARGVTVS